MSNDEAERQRGGEFLTSGRIVPVRREGNKVFVRTLRQGEEDTGEAVNVRAGDRVIFEPGALVIDSRQIDAQSTEGLGGYAPVANTVWTWYRVVGEEVGFFVFSSLWPAGSTLRMHYGRWLFKSAKMPKRRVPYPGERGS